MTNESIKIQELKRIIQGHKNLRMPSELYQGDILDFMYEDSTKSSHLVRLQKQKDKYILKAQGQVQQFNPETINAGLTNFIKSIKY